MKRQRYNAKKQRGVVLAVSLIMLVLITLLAVSGMRSATMEERMAGNSRNKNIAFQMAETALREAESLLQSEPQTRSIVNAQVAGTPAAPGSIGAALDCVVKTNFDDPTLNASWGGSPCEYAGDAYTGSNPPLFFVEFMPEANGPLVDVGDGTSQRACFYRITARGYGADSNSNVTLQTTYKFPNCS